MQVRMFRVVRHIEFFKFYAEPKGQDLFKVSSGA